MGYSTLPQSLEDSSLGGEQLIHQMVGLLLIRALTGWKKWADRNFVKLKHKCKALHLQWNIPMQQYRLEANWL